MALGRAGERVVGPYSRCSTGMHRRLFDSTRGPAPVHSEPRDWDRRSGSGRPGHELHHAERGYDRHVWRVGRVAPLDPGLIDGMWGIRDRSLPCLLRLL